MKKIILTFLICLLIICFTGCGGPGDDDDDNNDDNSTGSIEGYAFFDNETDHSNIIITLENTESTPESIMNRVIVDQTTTDGTGYYELTELIRKRILFMQAAMIRFKKLLLLI